MYQIFATHFGLVVVCRARHPRTTHIRCIFMSVISAIIRNDVCITDTQPRSAQLEWGFDTLDCAFPAAEKWWQIKKMCHKSRQHRLRNTHCRKDDDMRTDPRAAKCGGAHALNDAQFMRSMSPRTNSRISLRRIVHARAQSAAKCNHSDRQRDSLYTRI